MKKATKRISVFLVLLAAVFTLTSCENIIPPEKTAFTLQNDFSKRTLSVGEKTTYKVNLKNLTGDVYTLKCGEPLIKLEIITSEENESRKEVAEELAEYNILECDIAPHGQIEEFIDFTPEKAGSYVLKASCKFTIDGTENSVQYEYECVDLQITVEE